VEVISVRTILFASPTALVESKLDFNKGVAVISRHYETNIKGLG